MPNSFAFVSLLTSNPYLPGALTLAAALRDVHNSPSNPADAVPFDLVCLVTPETVDAGSIKLLRRAYDHVVGVEVIQQSSNEGLQLLGRPDLALVLTKLHVFRLIEYQKVIFLDADVLPLQPLAHLFQIPHEFAAVPDVGWPDIFNSGLMLLQPGNDKFKEVVSLAQSKGSWDGGDQGILNEWRGRDWHRLSFVYNTTPTAAYTYAPAYKRFGQNIKAIHFIGTNKPWSSLQYRAPYSSQALQNFGSKPPAFGYGDLVDRWYAVYDKHHRFQEPEAPESVDVTKYESAWNVPQVASKVPQVFSLEELRRIAVGGSGALNLQASPSTPGESTPAPSRHKEPPGQVPEHSSPAPIEGEYHSLPLEGRFYLLAPQPSSVSTPADAKLRSHVDEPPHSAISPSVQHPPETDRHDRSETSEHGHYSPLPAAAHQEAPQAEQRYHGETLQLTSQQTSEEPKERPVSQVFMHWNPAVEPPPSVAPPESAFQPTMHFQNVWDAPQGAPMPDSHSDARGFFVAPTQTKIPERLISEGHYANVVHALPILVPTPIFPEHRALSPETATIVPPIEAQPAEFVDPYRPDKSKVGAVFPWESKPRQIPGRVFPRAASPPPAASGVYVAPAPPSPVPSPPHKAPDEVLSPKSPGLPQVSSSSRSFQNAWDTFPSIQRYATKLQKPAAGSSAPAPSSSPKAKRSRRSSSSTFKSSTREDPNDSSSHEADVEDEGNDSSDEQSGAAQLKRAGRLISRPSSTFRDDHTGKTYRSQGVQTIEPSRGEKAVQVNSAGITTDVSGAVSTLPPKPPPAVSGHRFPLHLMSVSKAPILEQSLGTSIANESQWRPDGPSLQVPPQSLADEVGIAPKPATRTIYQRSSSDTISSQGPLSPPDSQTIPLPVTAAIDPVISPRIEPSHQPRLPVRTWDPARGVDVFKRESEEVLARFLRMGSWEGAHAH